MQANAERTSKKLARHATRLVKRHGAEVATSLLVSLVGSAATMLMERAQRKVLKAAKKAKKHRKAKKQKRDVALARA